MPKNSQLAPGAHPRRAMSQASATRKHHTIFVVDETLLRGSRTRKPTFKVTMLARSVAARPPVLVFPPKLEKPPVSKASLGITPHKRRVAKLNKLSPEALTELLRCKEDCSFLYSSDDESNSLDGRFERIERDADDTLHRDLESLDNDFFSFTDDVMKLVREVVV